jgi:prolipoprotein diacylglyceryl transferase
VANATLDGDLRFMNDPLSIIKPPIAGLHFFGGLLFGGITLIVYLKKTGHDIWLFLDAIAPAILIGQALGRLGNFINQELYGPPTKLPWGILIDAGHRLPQYQDFVQYPLETTRFHPTFAYELILNILAALFLLWISRQYWEKMKPGAIFAGWLIAAGLIRTFIEFFRPDQPRIGETFITTSMLVSFLMAIAGLVMLLARYKKLLPALAENWEEDYSATEMQEEEEEEIKKKPAEVPAPAKKPVAKKKVPATVVVETEASEEDEAVSQPVKKKKTPSKAAQASKPKASVRKTTKKQV